MKLKDLKPSLNGFSGLTTNGSKSLNEEHIKVQVCSAWAAFMKYEGVMNKAH